MKAGANDECLNCLLPERLAGFQAVNTLDQNVAALPGAHLDGPLFPLIHDFLSNGLDLCVIKFLAALGWNVNFLDSQDNGAHNCPLLWPNIRAWKTLSNLATRA